MLLTSEFLRARGRAALVRSAGFGPEGVPASSD